MKPVNPNTPSKLEQETGAIIRELQNRLIEINPLTMETPKDYAKKKLQENDGMKGMARIFISNMLHNCYLQSDIDFYSSALKELDLIN